MPINPAISQNAIQNVRAEVLPRAAMAKFDQTLIDKMAARVPLFQGMSAEQIVNLLTVGEPCELIEGAPVFREGDNGSSFYVLLSGEVVVEKLRNHQQVELARLGVGHCFGEMALVGDEVRSATVRVTKAGRGLRFRRATIESEPVCATVVYRNIARILAKRLGDLSLMLADLTSRPNLDPTAG